jgi:hypothetical protein
MEASFNVKMLKITKDYDDRILRKDVEIEELNDLLEKLRNVSSDQGSKLKSAITDINEKRKAEELRVSQQVTIK